MGGGYASARLFKQLKGADWVWNVMLALVVFPAPLTATFTVLNTTALTKASTAALPLGTILVVVALFLFVGRHRRDVCSGRGPSRRRARRRLPGSRCRRLQARRERQAVVRSGSGGVVLTTLPGFCLPMAAII